MACINPELKKGTLCKMAVETSQRVCGRCKHSVSNEEADAIRKTQRYNARMQARSSRNK